MKLTKLTVRNWRPYHGEQTVEFTTNPDQPLTVFFTPNGGGKTSLLNAFTWCLYEKFTKGFRRPDDLVNHQAQVESDGAATAKVVVEFEHEEAHWTVTRETPPPGHKQNSVIVERKALTGDDAGKTKTREIRDVHRILPPTLSDFFFMPGESLSTESLIASRDPEAGDSFAGERVAKAIRSLLDFDVYQNAITDLAKASNEDSLKLPQNFRDETIKSAEETANQAKNRHQAARDRLGELPDLIEDAIATRAEKERAAQGIDRDAIDAWREKHDALVSNRTEAEKKADAVAAALFDVLRSSYRYYADHAVATAVSDLDRAERDGQIPPRIASDVLDKMIERPNMRCVVCRRPMGKDEHDHVIELRKRVTDTDLATEAMEVRARMRRHQETSARELESFRDRLTELGATQLDEATWRDLVEAADDLWDRAAMQVAKAREAVADYLDENPEEQVKARKSALDEYVNAHRRVDELQREKKELSAEVEDLKRIADEKAEEYARKMGRQNRYTHLVSARELLQKAEDFFTEAQRGITEFGRADFERAMNRYYKKLVAKEYEVRVREDFTIDVLQGGRAIAPSQSETVLLTIAFLEAIASLAPEYRKLVNSADSGLFDKLGQVEGSDENAFPVVLDAPYSPLDDDYPERLTNALPRTLPQIVVFVTRSYAQNLKDIEQYVGKAYVLRRDATASDNATPAMLHWAGKDYDYITVDDDAEFGATRVCVLS